MKLCTSCKNQSPVERVASRCEGRLESALRYPNRVLSHLLGLVISSAGDQNDRGELHGGWPGHEHRGRGE